MAVSEADKPSQPESSQPEPKTEGQRVQQFGTVFYISIAIAAAFVAAGVFLTEPFGAALTAVVGQIIKSLGWMYLLITTGFLVFVIFLAFSRYGRIKLGKPDDEPEFGLFSWFAMLFQAGMGIGIIFWGVSEPLLHYSDPPLGQAARRTPAAAELALQYAFFHWTLHPWGIYAVVGLAVGYFSFRTGMTNLRISSVFHPLLGDRVDGPIGKTIDVVAIIATLFGIAVSLGLGTLSIEAGLGRAFGVPGGVTTQLLIIGITAIAYMLSASTPIERGVQWLSNASMVLAVVILAYFIAIGPTILQANTFTQQIGVYMYQLIPMSLRINAFNPDPWIGDWTIFFWATWIAWAPFVGAFIARISKGRTIRQFVLGVLAAPSLFSILWFSVFGSSAIDLDQRIGGTISRAAASDEAIALFDFLFEFPLPLVTSTLMIFLVWIFFVAGADAGTIVLGSMSSGGVLEPKRTIKLTWGVIMGAIAAILLLVGTGGIDALQQGAILAATPFGLLMLPICWSLYRALVKDYREERQHAQQIMAYDVEIEARQLEEIMKPPRRSRKMVRATAHPRREEDGESAEHEGEGDGRATSSKGE